MSERIVLPTHFNFKNRIGQTFARLTVIEFAGRSAGGQYQWKCKCSCGKEVVRGGLTLISGHTKSCGCKRNEKTRERGESLRTHIRGKRSGTFNVWQRMKSRCVDNTRERYCGRGIRVCERWMTFENFYADMGDRPPGMTIDRIDNEGDYRPGNCRWATQRTQCRNKSNNRMVRYAGRDMTVVELSESTGVRYAVLESRLWRGWTVDRAVRTPARAFHRANRPLGIRRK